MMVHVHYIEIIYLYISDIFESNIEINIKDQKLIQRENLAMPKDRCHHFPPSFSVNSHMGSLCSPLRTDKIQSFSVCKFRNVRTKLFGSRVKIFEGSLPKQIQPRKKIDSQPLLKFTPLAKEYCDFMERYDSVMKNIYLAHQEEIFQAYFATFPTLQILQCQQDRMTFFHFP